MYDSAFFIEWGWKVLRVLAALQVPLLRYCYDLDLAMYCARTHLSLSIYQPSRMVGATDFDRVVYIRVLAS